MNSLSLEQMVDVILKTVMKMSGDLKPVNAGVNKLIKKKVNCFLLQCYYFLTIIILLLYIRYKCTCTTTLNNYYTHNDKIQRNDAQFLSRENVVDVYFKPMYVLEK